MHTLTRRGLLGAAKLEDVVDQVLARGIGGDIVHRVSEASVMRQLPKLGIGGIGDLLFQSRNVACWNR